MKLGADIHLELYKVCSEPLTHEKHIFYGSYHTWTKKPPNVVNKCIKRFSSPFEIVCDPYLGGAVTLYEALGLSDLIENLPVRNIPASAKDFASLLRTVMELDSSHVKDRPRRFIGIEINPYMCFIHHTYLTTCTSHEALKIYSEGLLKILPLLEELHHEYFERGSSSVLAVYYNDESKRDDLRERKYVVDEVKVVDSNQFNNMLSLVTKFVESFRDGDYKEDILKRVLKIINKFDRARYVKGDATYHFNTFVYENLDMDKPMIENPRINVRAGYMISNYFTPRNWNIITSCLKLKMPSIIKFLILDRLRELSKLAHRGGGAYQQFYNVFRTGMKENNPIYIIIKKWLKTLPAVIILNKLLLALADTWTIYEANSLDEVLSKDILCTIICDDFLKVEIPENTVDYVHTDPPYGDQIPFLELHYMEICLGRLVSDYDLTERLKRELCISNAPSRTEKFVDTSTLIRARSDEAARESLLSYKGFLNFSDELFRGLSKCMKMLKPGKYFTLWYCSTIPVFYDKVIRPAFVENPCLEPILSLPVLGRESFKDKISRCKDILTVGADILFIAKKVLKRVNSRKSSDVKIIDVIKEIVRNRGEISLGELYLGVVTELMAHGMTIDLDIGRLKKLCRSLGFNIIKGKGEQYIVSCKQKTLSEFLVSSGFDRR